MYLLGLCLCFHLLGPFTGCCVLFIQFFEYLLVLSHQTFEPIGLGFYALESLGEYSIFILLPLKFGCLLLQLLVGGLDLSPYCHQSLIRQWLDR